RLGRPSANLRLTYDRWWSASGPLPWGQALVVAGILGAALIYGGWRLQYNDFRSGPRVALLQGNLDQRIRNDATSPGATQQTIHTVATHYAGLCEIAMHAKPDLIVWPETSYPYFWAEASPKLSIAKVGNEHREFLDYIVFIKDNLRGLKKFGDTYHLLG